VNYKITDAEGNEVPLWMGPMLADGDDPVRPDETSFWADRRSNYRVVVTA